MLLPSPVCCEESFLLPLKLNYEKLLFLRLNSKKKSLIRVDDLTEYCTLLQS